MENNEYNPLSQKWKNKNKAELKVIKKRLNKISKDQYLKNLLPSNKKENPLGFAS